MESLVVVEELRRDFTAAISSNRNDVTLDPSIAELREKISSPDYQQPFSIYSRAHLRQINDVLARISAAHLREDPLQVAVAVDAILQLFGQLESTVEQSAASNKRIEANRSS